ncbi:hypothetical protein JTE90_024068 [Oedothorax gibbosus]|uniref:Fibronectin type-III domain-containing protein n=1 Tax=Oedothorax gibbosus TaxID=931172 RepID=A0AAV6U217_9ARAC|nr:hypothetical protein JTE90_024068 [Oedothorax gibbosus]
MNFLSRKKRKLSCGILHDRGDVLSDICCCLFCRETVSPCFFSPPTSPVAVVTGSTKSTIDIKWEKDAKDKSAITEYTLHYKTDDGRWQQEQLTTDLDRHTLRNLKCGSRYHLYMTAANSLGTGEPSEAVTTHTQGAAPMSPQEQAFIQPDVGSATLRLSAWQSGGCPIRHFVIRYKPKYSSQWTDIPDKLDGARESYVLRSLVPNREYDVVVTANSEAGMTQADYSFRTLSTGGPPSSPAFGKRETDLPFYKNVALVIPVVVSALVLLMLVFIVVVCLRKHNQDRRASARPTCPSTRTTPSSFPSSCRPTSSSCSSSSWSCLRKHNQDRREYEMRKPSGDSLMMSDLGKQVTDKSSKTSHYSCPTGNKGGDYAEPYSCNDVPPSRQGNDGLFATIKRCPTRPIYTSATYKQGSEIGPQMSTHDSTGNLDSNSSDRWRHQAGHKPSR